MAKDSVEALWADATRRYAEISGLNFEDLPRPRSIEDLIKSVIDQNRQYEKFRQKQDLLLTVLETALKPIELVGNLAAGAASAVFPPSSMCFGAVMYLINAAHGVSASLDAIAGLLDELKDVTIRLKIYNQEDLSQELKEKLTTILVTLIEIFARSTKIVKDGFLYRLKSMGKNVLLGSDSKSQDLMTHLKRLTLNEARLVGVEALVEAKRTGKAIGAVQTSIQRQTTQLGHLTISTNEMAAGVGQILSTLEDSKAESKTEKEAKHLETIKKVLRPSVASQDRFDEIRREHVPDSGLWIRSEKVMQTWISNEVPLLWISGNPGSGKSFLTYNIITYLHELHDETTALTSYTSVAYFFFRDNNEATRSFEQALRDVAYQIAAIDASYAKYINKIASSSPDVMTIRSAWQKLFLDYFAGEEASKSSAYLVFDGIDEASQEGREIFFDLLNDITEAGAASKLRIALLGRPHIADELSEQLNESVLTLAIDWTKNSEDIARYVELSITKSRVLNRVSQSLKQHIIQTLCRKADGMFMWVKLMLAELSKKSRESTIREALNKAPKGLTEMLRHLLEGFSATLSEEDAGDLNDMLSWVTLAKRPLSLGEIDSMLRLKSETGDGILFLEGRLRKQFSSFFSLAREDNLTTADLLAPKTAWPEEIYTTAGAEPEEGLEDVENEVDFNSNTSTTTVSFSHASISDFLRDPKQGKVVATSGSKSAVGVDLAEARSAVAKTCVDLLTSTDIQSRLGNAANLKSYAGSFWTDHLDELDPTAVSATDRIHLGISIVRLMREESLLPALIWPRNYAFYTEERARRIFSWVDEKDVVSALPADQSDWIKSIAEKPIALFEPAIRHTGKVWLLLLGGNDLVCVGVIAAYLRRREGEVVDQAPIVTADDLRNIAQWMNLDQTAEWHRRVAKTLRELRWYDESLSYFEKTLELDATMWRATSGVAIVLQYQGKYQESIDRSEAALKMIETLEKVDSGNKNNDMAQEHYRIAECYYSMFNNIDRSGDLVEKIRLSELVLEHHNKTFLLDHRFYASVNACIAALDTFAHPSLNGLSPSRNARLTDILPPNLPTQTSCYERIMGMLYALDKIDEGGSSYLVMCLQAYLYDAEDTLAILAEAAMKLGQIDWLRVRYESAIAYADKTLQPVRSAYLSLALARLCLLYGEIEAKGMRVLRSLGTGHISTALANEINYVRSTAIDVLGQYCIRKAIENRSNAERYVEEMESIVSKRRHGSRLGSDDYVPPNGAALHLAAWYCHVGQQRMALDAVMLHIKDALIILSDDDPTNDIAGNWYLIGAFVAIGDDKNALAVMHSIRRYKNGMAYVEDPEDDPSQFEMDQEGGDDSDENDDDQGTGEEQDNQANGALVENLNQPSAESTEDNTQQDDTDDNEIEMEETNGFCCEGICGDEWYHCDGMIICRYCTLTFCRACHQLLLDDNLPVKICGKYHQFLTVPYLTREQVFRKGEMLVDRKAVTVEEWKADLKKQYGL